VSKHGNGIGHNTKIESKHGNGIGHNTEIQEYRTSQARTGLESSSTGQDNRGFMRSGQDRI
jgi:hypothetical protein